MFDCGGNSVALARGILPFLIETERMLAVSGVLSFDIFVGNVSVDLLLGGSELRFPTNEFGFTWRAQSLSAPRTSLTICC